LQFGFATAHHKITPRGKSGHGPGLGELSKIWGCPLIYSPRLKIATSRFQAGGLCQGPSQSPTQKKSGRGHGLEELSKIFGFTFNISTTADDSDFKISKLVRFAEAHHKIPLRRKRAWLWARGATKNLGFSL